MGEHNQSSIMGPYDSGVDGSSSARFGGVEGGLDSDILVQAEADMKNNLFLLNLGKWTHFIQIYFN